MGHGRCRQATEVAHPTTRRIQATTIKRRRKAKEEQKTTRSHLIRPSSHARLPRGSTPDRPRCGFAPLCRARRDWPGHKNRRITQARAAMIQSIAPQTIQALTASASWGEREKNCDSDMSSSGTGSKTAQIGNESCPLLSHGPSLWPLMACGPAVNQTFNDSAAAPKKSCNPTGCAPSDTHRCKAMA